MGYTIHFSEVVPYTGLLAKGLLMGIGITIVATLVGTVLGLFSALARLSSLKVLRTTADVYVEVIRNTPLLVQMYLIYFGLGQFNVQVPPIAAAILAMTINTGAYTTVIFEAGIKAIDFGQKEAAFALGMTAFQTYRYIILPPAFRIVLPPLMNQAISLFLFSSVASTVSVPELTYQSLYVESVTLRTFEVFTVTTGLYFVTTLLASLISQVYERSRPAPYVAR